MSPSGGIIDKLMEYIWSHWEDPIDVREGGEREGGSNDDYYPQAIRHQCRIMFENIVNIYVKLRNKGTITNDKPHP